MNIEIIIGVFLLFLFVGYMYIQIKKEKKSYDKFIHNQTTKGTYE